jgi:LysR family tcuABC transcriptional regulator
MDWYTSMLNFVRTVDTGSLAKAARELDVVPSAISKSISRLERCADVQLLERSTRKLVPTEAGWAFYRVAKDAVTVTQVARETIKQFARLNDADQ